MTGIGAFATGLSGLTTNARRLDTIGNNIANVNTTAFKSSRMMFNPSITRTFNVGTSPSSTSGGTNPMEIGLGVSIAGTQRNFGAGAISATGIPTDVAIEGDGFFIVEQATEQFYTRNGAFQLNEGNDLVSLTGQNVMGYGVDNNFGIVDADLVELNIPVGTLAIAEATENVTFSGNLNASGDLATTGSIHTVGAFYTDIGLTTAVTAATDLTTTDVYMDDGTGAGALAFASGDPGPMLTLNGVEKGGKDLGNHTFEFTTGVSTADASGSTFQDYMDWLDEVLGLHNTTINGEELGGGVSMAAGVITITGNEGTAQDLDIESSDIVASNNTGGASTPFVTSKTGDADGESVRTSFVVYDSLGAPVTVDLTFVLQDTTTGTGSTWFFVAESNDNAASDRLVGTGVVEFDFNGRFLSASSEQFQVQRDNGALDPMVVDIDLAMNNNVTALTDTLSTMSAIYQDGSPIGTLADFSIGVDGSITGLFTNGLTRPLGQVAIAKFSNPEGLQEAGNALFRIGPNSGTPIITAPLEFGAGRVIGGALEQSNVDLSKEFTDMILASMGYSAAGRVITTADELINQLLLIGR